MLYRTLQCDVVGAKRFLAACSSLRPKGMCIYAHNPASMVDTLDKAFANALTYSLLFVSLPISLYRLHSTKLRRFKLTIRNPSMFEKTKRGFTFEIEGECRAAKTPVVCGVSFLNNTTNIVTKFGDFGYKHVPSNADIAGVGVSYYYFDRWTSFLTFCFFHRSIAHYLSRPS